MNLLEHYVEEIHDVVDISDEIKQYAASEQIKEPLLEVDMTYNCYGTVTRRKRRMFQSEFQSMQKNGYFMA